MQGDSKQVERHRGLREFVLDNLIVTAAQILAKLRGLLTLPLIVKTLGTEGFGIWAQILAFVGFAGVVAALSLHLPLMRFVAADRSLAARAFSALLVVTLAVAAVLVIVLMGFTGPMSALLLGDTAYAPHIMLGLLLIPLQNVRILSLSLLRAIGKFAVRSAIEVLAALVELLGILVVLASGYSLLEAIAWMVAWNTFAVAATAVYGLRHVGLERPDWQIARNAFVYALPLLPAAIAGMVLDRVDRFLIGHHHGAKELGIYAASAALGTLVLHFQFPLQMTLVPKVAELWDRDRETARRYISLSTKAFLTIAIPYTVMIPVAAPILLRALGNDEIAARSGPLSCLIALGCLLWGVSIMQNQIFHGAQKTRTIGLVTALAAVASLSLNALLVPRFGALAAAGNAALSYGASCLLFSFSARRIMKLDFAFRYLLKCVLSALGGLGVLLVIGPVGLGGLFVAAAFAVLVMAGVLVVTRAFSPEETAFFRAAWRRTAGRLFSP